MFLGLAGWNGLTVKVWGVTGNVQENNLVAENACETKMPGGEEWTPSTWTSSGGRIESSSSFLYTPQLLNQPPPFPHFPFSPHFCSSMAAGAELTETMKVQEVGCIDSTAGDVGYNGQQEAGGRWRVTVKCMGGCYCWDRGLSKRLVAIRKKNLFGEISVCKTVRGSERNKTKREADTKAANVNKIIHEKLKWNGEKNK